jgi:hypothetical protein
MRRLDLSGHKYGMLTVVTLTAPTGHARKRAAWLCRCDCGVTTTVQEHRLKTGNTKSCGCLRAINGRRNRTHGLSGSRAYSVWCSIIARCENPRESGYPNYGGRGIVMCPEWRTSFAQFLEDMGPPPPNRSIERLDNDGPYAPNNCVWADRVTQNNNSRRNRLVTWNGRTQTLAQWSRERGIPYATMKMRLNHHWDVDRVMLKRP